jgi:hypothetical protein
MILAQVAVLVQLTLVGVGDRTVEASLGPDSVLALPAADLHDLLGITWPSPLVPLPALKAAFPPVSFTWYPDKLLLYIDDPGQVLPASRAAHAAILRQSRGAASFAQQTSGPFLAFAGDSRNNTRVDAGYNYRGRAFLSATHSDVKGTSWSLGAAPVPRVFVSTAGGQHQPLAVSGRVNTGPLWFAPTYSTTDHVLRADALIVAGPVAVFGSTRGVYVLTVRGRGGDLQVGRSAGVTAARLSFGPIPPSQFSFPITQ